ncbi:MAG: Crp/Fnr family transcriptional regulator [Pseudomonadota bacterium]
MEGQAVGPISGFVVAALGADLIGYIGVLGVFFYIGSYLALQLGLIRGDGYPYPVLNLIGSGSVLISLSTHFNPFSAFIETSWVTISLIGIARHWFVMRYVRLSEDEQRVAGVLVPRLKKDRAKRFLRLGRFVDAEAGLALATEGQPLRDLSLVVRGHCRIERRGQLVAVLRDGALVGELTYATGAPATASVVVADRTLLFQIDCGDLRAFLARNPDIAAELEASITGDLRGKLAEATRRLSEQAGAGSA